MYYFKPSTRCLILKRLQVSPPGRRQPSPWSLRAPEYLARRLGLGMVGACTSLRIPVSFAVSSSVISVSLPSFPMGETGDHGTGGHDEQDNHDDGDEDDDEYDDEEENKSMELAAL